VGELVNRFKSSRFNSSTRSCGVTVWGLRIDSSELGLQHSTLNFQNDNLLKGDLDV
jgi:hypothetical protein